MLDLCRLSMPFGELYPTLRRGAVRYRLSKLNARRASWNSSQIERTLVIPTNKVSGGRQGKNHRAHPDLVYSRIIFGVLGLPPIAN